MVAADQNGEQLATLDYYIRGSDVAATLTELFGFAPEIEITEPIASDFIFSGTRYNWEGFRLDWKYGYESDPDSGVGKYPYLTSIVVTASVATVRGVIIQGTDAIAVGDGKGDLWGRYPEQSWNYTDNDGVLIETAAAACVDLPEFIDPYESGVPKNCLAVRAVDGIITGLQAPWAVNYGL